MNAAGARVTVKAALGLAQLSIMLGIALFAPAGTLQFVEAWVLLALFLAASLAITVYLAKSDPALLERRTQAGPAPEADIAQK